MAQDNAGLLLYEVKALHRLTLLERACVWRVWGHGLLPRVYIYFIVPVGLPVKNTMHQSSAEETRKINIAVRNYRKTVRVSCDAAWRRPREGSSQLRSWALPNARE